FRAGESAAGTDGAVVNQRATLDDFSAVVNGNFRVLKHTVSIVVTDAQFGNLAGAAGRGILVALATGLRVVKRAETVGDSLDLIEFGLIGRVGGVVDQTIALVVETSRSLRYRRSESKKT